MNVYDLGLLLFRDEVLHHPRVKEHLRSTLLSMVAQERRGEIGDRCVGVVYRECRGTGVEGDCSCQGVLGCMVCWECRGTGVEGDCSCQGVWVVSMHTWSVGVRGWKGTSVQVFGWCS